MRSIPLHRPGAAALGTLFLVAASVHADDLGTIAFPTSGADEAQVPFMEGVKALHSFQFEEATSAFRRAQQIDPDFALAYWGEAMSYNHPLWAEQDTAAGHRTRRGTRGRARRAPGRRARGGPRCAVGSARADQACHRALRRDAARGGPPGRGGGRVRRVAPARSKSMPSLLGLAHDAAGETAEARHAYTETATMPGARPDSEAVREAQRHLDSQR